MQNDKKDKCETIGRFISNPKLELQTVIDGINELKKNKNINHDLFFENLNFVIDKLREGKIHLFNLWTDHFRAFLFISKIIKTKEEVVPTLEYFTKYKSLPENEKFTKFYDYEPIKNAKLDFNEFQIDLNKEHRKFTFFIWAVKLLFFIASFAFGLTLAIFLEKIIDILNLNKVLIKYVSVDFIFYLKVALSFTIGKYIIKVPEEKAENYLIGKRLTFEQTKIMKLINKFENDYDEFLSNIKTNRQEAGIAYTEYCQNYFFKD